MGIIFELVLVFSLVIGFGVYELWSLKKLAEEREAKARENAEGADEGQQTGSSCGSPDDKRDDA